MRWNWDGRTSTSPRKPLAARRTRTGPPGGERPTGGITLTYRFNEDASSYWKYSHGWKPGTFNTVAQACAPQEQSCGVTSADPETIDAWESGLRGTWFDGALTIGSALFFYKYENYQVFVVKDSFAAPPTFTIVNANDAQVYGAELDVRVEPLLDLVPAEMEGLVINARVGWLESEFLDFTNTVTRSGELRRARIEVEVDASGNQLINSPRFKVSGSAEWTFDFGRWGAVIPRYDFSWSSRHLLRPLRGTRHARQLGRRPSSPSTRRASGATGSTTCASPTACPRATSRSPAGAATSRTRPTRPTPSTRPPSRTCCSTSSASRACTAWISR